MKAYKVSVIVPFFKDLNDLKECILSLLKSDYPIYEVIIIDNGSEEGGVEKIIDLSPSIKILREDENKGFSAAVNRGMQLSGDESDLLWIINSDIVLEKDSMRALVETFEKDDSVGIAGSRLYSYDDKEILLGCGGSIDWKGLFCYHRGCGEKDLGQYDLAEDVDYIPGCSLMIRKRVIEDVGQFDKRFFMYFEDVDICVRMKQGGYRVVYVPASRVFHKERSFEIGRGHSKLFSYYIVRNSLYFFRTYGKIKPFNFIKWLFINLRSNATSISKLIYCLRGIVDFFLGKTGRSCVK